MKYTIVLEVEYLAETESEALRRAGRDIQALRNQKDVSSAHSYPKPFGKDYPITEAYLNDVHQMDIDECIAEAMKDQ